MLTFAQQKHGGSILNSAINHLPVELHIPGYSYCGPGTKLTKRLRRGDVGINKLDSACKDHDIAYARHPHSLSDRHRADLILADKAAQRITAPDAKLSEKIAALAVAGAMKAKVKLGLGINNKRDKSMKNNMKKKKNKSKSKMRKNTNLKGSRKKIGKNVLKGLIKNIRSGLKSMKPTAKLWDVAKAAYKIATVSAPKTKSGGIKERILPIPKSGGFLPLIPIFAALSALGGLAGGAAGVAKTVIEAKNARRELSELQRHNQTMEAIALRKGKGLYLGPYRKNGLGLYIGRRNKKKNSP